jgi:hypothetical protein
MVQARSLILTLFFTEENSMPNAAIYLTLAYALTSVAAYAAPAKEGDIDALQCGHGPAFVNSISQDAMAGSYSVTVMVVTNEGSLYHNVSGICSGSWQLVKGDYAETGSCDYVDLQGDHFFGLYTRKGGEGDFKVYAGTGKYVGLEQTGRFMPLGEYFQVQGENRSCVKFKGHWKMK